MIWNELHLGDVFRMTLTWIIDMHVNFILNQCNHRLYVLKLLRSQGLSSFQFSTRFLTPSLYMYLGYVMLGKVSKSELNLTFSY